jgi:hypothetical protein
MKSKPRFKFPDTTTVDTCEDVTIKNGRLYLQGEALEKVRRMAKEAGMPMRKFLMQRIREVTKDPDWLENFIRDQGDSLGILGQLAKERLNSGGHRAN